MTYPIIETEDVVAHPDLAVHKLEDMVGNDFEPRGIVHHVGGDSVDLGGTTSDLGRVYQRREAALLKESYPRHTTRW
jgi:hypothetical protein